MASYKQYITVLIIGWMLSALSVQAQEITVSGSVIDRSADPVVGATITITEDTVVQTTTDSNGQFSISAKSGQHLTVTTRKGGSRTVAVRQEPMNLTVARDLQISHGMSRSPEGLTGAVSTIRGDELTKSMILNPENALYGRLSGLMVLQNSGLPPTSPRFLVRGRGTFANSAPLVLVDGFEHPLSSLSPGDIEQVTVLKDAAVLALYGQRGANGVVRVTTKRGGRDGLEVIASYEMGLTWPTALPDFLEAPAYGRALNEARANDGRNPLYSSADLQAFEEGTSPYLFPNVDWFDEVLRDHGVRNNLNLHLRGGGDRARYFTTLSYVGDSGLFGSVDRNEGYNSQFKHQRFKFRSNLDIDLTDDLLFQADVAGNLIENNIPGGGANDIFNAMYQVPSAAFPVKTPDGHWGGTSIYGNNPVAILTATGSRQPNAREFSLTGRLRKDLSSWIEGLSAEAEVSYYNFGEFFESETRSYNYQSVGNGTVYGQNTDLSFSDSFGNEQRFTDVLGKLHYTGTIGRSAIEATVLFHQSGQIYDGRDNTFRRRNFAGNLRFGWAGKYFLDLAASYSGNNLLPPGDRYGFFPAVSAGWLLSEEDFLRETGFLDRLKLRASWGMSGSDRLPTGNPYEADYTSLGSSSEYWFRDGNQDQTGVYETNLAVDKFTFETAYQANVGLEARLFGRLDLSGDLFYVRRTNIWTGTNGRVSGVLGIDPSPASEGIVDNRGMEIAMKWNGAVGDLAYHLGGQFSFARNEIVEQNEQYRPYPYLQRTGQPVGQRFGLEAIGFFQDQADIDNSPQQSFSEVQPGDIKYRDQNADGVINEFDEVPLGYADYPEIYFSANLGFQYKGFSVSTLLQGTGHQTVNLYTPSVFRPLGNSNNTISTWYYDRRWTPQTAGTATLPRLTTEDNDNNFRNNDIWLVDGSYIKLRTLEISYSLPVSLVKPWKMDNVQLYLRGMNLFSIDDVPELDPEYLGTGYPLLRSYSAGVEIQF